MRFAEVYEPVGAAFGVDLNHVGNIDLQDQIAQRAIGTFCHYEDPVLAFGEVLVALSVLARFENFLWLSSLQENFELAERWSQGSKAFPQLRDIEKVIGRKLSSLLANLTEDQRAALIVWQESAIAECAVGNAAELTPDEHLERMKFNLDWLNRLAKPDRP